MKLRRKQIPTILFFTVISIITLYPFWYCLVGSLMSYMEYMQTSFLLWPKEIVWDAYRYILEQGQIFAPFRMTVLITVLGTAINLIVTILGGYALSKTFPGSRFIAGMMALSLFVYAGLIPEYVLNRQLHLLNSMRVYLIPTMVNAYYLIIARTFFRSFPTELEEAAILDGCTPFQLFCRIVVPLSMPLLASLGLFLAVDYWNMFTPSLYFVTNVDKKTLQDYLYTIISSASSEMPGGSMSMNQGSGAFFSETIKMANTVVAMVPILLIYPLIQKYFANGIMIGAVKG